MPENKHLRFFCILLYTGLALLFFWLFFKYILGLLAPFIIAFLFSRIIDRPTTLCEKRLNFPRPLASILMTVLCFGTLGTLIYFASVSIFDFLVGWFDKLANFDMSSFDNVFLNLKSHLPAQIQSYVNANSGSWLSSIVDSLKSFIAPMIAYITNFATSLPSVLIFIIASIVSTYFFTNDYTTIKAKLRAAVPEKWKARIIQTKREVSSTLFRYIKALLVLMLITFAELSIGFLILGVDNAILLGAVIAVIDALPILGTGWILMPWSIYSLLTQNFYLAIGLPILYCVIAIVRNSIEPKIVGNHIGLHPLATLMSMYIGLKLFGIIGMFMPIPIALMKQFWEWGYFDSLFSSTSSDKKTD